MITWKIDPTIILSLHSTIICVSELLLVTDVYKKKRGSHMKNDCPHLFSVNGVIKFRLVKLVDTAGCKTSVKVVK